MNRKMGRPIKWNFEDHKDTLRRLWVDEKMKMPQLRDYMKLRHEFAPVPGAYFRKFTEWGFERKVNPILKDEKLHARVKELWAQNYGSDDILRITREEGFETNRAVITRIRNRFGLILKLPGGYGNPKRTMARKQREMMKQKASQNQSQSQSASAEREHGEEGDEEGDAGGNNSGGEDDSGGSDGEEEEEEDGEEGDREDEDGPGEVEQQLQQVQEHTNSLNNGPASGYGGNSTHDHWNTVSNQPYRGGMRQWDNSYPLGYGPPTASASTLATSGWQQQQEQQQEQEQDLQQQEPRQTGSQPPDEAELAAKREQRKRQIEAEAEELWRTKKRRRHTKQYGFLPPDPAGPPRYPSETTLTEAKEILQLDQQAYMGIRERFYNICMSHGVIKKTLIGPERWKQFKDQLIRESLHLRAAMWDQENIEQKKLAVEIICNDITKRVRTTQTKVSVLEAKRLLGLDPDAGREIRAQFYNILAVERFGPVLEEGVERFRELRQRWIDANEVLKEAWTNQEDPEHARKVKAVIALGRDAERRYHADVYGRGIDPLRPRSPTPEPSKKPKSPKPPRPPKPPKVPKKRGRPRKAVPSVEVPEVPGDDAVAPAAAPAAASVVAPSVPAAPATAPPAPSPAPRSRRGRKNAAPAPTPTSAPATTATPAPAPLQFIVTTPVPPVPTDPNMVPGLRLPVKNRRGRPPKQSEAQMHTEVHFAPPPDAEPSPEADDQELMDAQLGYGDDYVPDDTPEPLMDEQVQEVQGQAPVQQQQAQQQRQQPERTMPAPNAENRIEPGFVGPLTLKQAQEKWLREQALLRQREQAAQQAAAQAMAAARSQQAQNKARQNPQAQYQQQLGQATPVHQHGGQPQVQQQFHPATPGQPHQGSLVASLRQMYHQPQTAGQQQQAQIASPAQQQQPQMTTPIQQPQAQMTAPSPAVPPPAPAPLTKGTFPAYFRLHNAIRGLFPGMRPQWIHLLSSRKYNDLKEAAVAKTPGAMCYKIEGIVKDGSGGELPLPVTDDMELETYLEHIEGNGGGAPMFNVHLFPGGI
ncbi:hypothetical protein QBC41DRAFT_283668 [Cercophora samala]|uniref:Clr5 domain-containing protein n=1 Tax=Cercophora samala TaxID=330535 RepID=A0AA39Z5L7_9PEZI|nr:hypothetical protein QBC41DRAFT_283668 [Cercophora samala]